MAQHTMTDNAAGSPIWAVQQLNKAVNTANRTALYNNVTAGGFHSGRTDGVFGVSTTEMSVSVAEAAGELERIAVSNSGTGLIDLSPWPSINIADGTGGETLLYLAVTNVEIDNVGTAFVPGETLVYNSGASNIVLTTVAVRAVSATATVAGSGYANGNVIRLVGGAGETIAAFDVTTGAANTGIATLAINAVGSYTTIPTFPAATTNVTGSGTGATINVVFGLDEVEITTPGNTSTFIANSETIAANVTSGDGVGDRVTLLFGVSAVGIVNSGTGYTSASVITGPTPLTGEAFSITVSDGVSPGNPVAHAGWHLRTVGSGGRAGRVFYECLVAASSMNSGTSDDTQFPNS